MGEVGEEYIKSMRYRKRGMVMGKVHYTTLEDMEKYNKNFNRKLYEDKEEDEVNAEFKEFYAKNLPVDLLTWCRVNEPEEKMLWKQGYWDQIMFVRDTVNPLFYSTYEEWKDNPVKVINTHRSKSIALPVYEIYLKQHDVKMIVRYNFYDWKISVISKTEINIDFMGLFDECNTINSIYCEGFKEEQVFQSFKENKKQFTVEISGMYQVFTFMFLLNNFLKHQSN
jgi:hypothetical protein